MDIGRNIAALVLAFWLGWTYGVFKVTARFRFRTEDGFATRMLVILHGVLFVCAIPLAVLAVVSVLGTHWKSLWLFGGVLGFVGGMVMAAVSWSFARDSDSD